MDANLCDGCGVCAKRCQVDAVSAPAKKQPAAVDLDRCIGCGLCVPTCPKKAMSLLKKPAEVVPPKTREDLYDIIMVKKKGKLGKLKLAGKITVDSIRAGRTKKPRN